MQKKIMKINKFFEESSLLIRVVSETIENEPKGEKVDFSAFY